MDSLILSVSITISHCSWKVLLMAPSVCKELMNLQQSNMADFLIAQIKYLKTFFFFDLVLIFVMDFCKLYHLYLQLNLIFLVRGVVLIIQVCHQLLSFF